MIWWCIAPFGEGEVDSHADIFSTLATWSLAMTDQTPRISAELPCHLCGYDLRAHPPDGRCPECGASVAESRRVAAIPLRPTWQNSDPRWRRRILAGVWVLVLLPLMELMDVREGFGWATRVPVPTFFGRFTIGTLDGSLLCDWDVYAPLVFCTGVVLLFSKERERRQGKLDWTRRWGILCSYVVFMLSAASTLFVVALVLKGIAASFQTIPLKYRPQGTQLVVDLSTVYSRYGPTPRNTWGIARVGFSSITILLACVPLYDALRSSGPRRVATVLLAPLVLFSLMHLGQVGYYLAFSNGASARHIFHYQLYFWLCSRDWTMLAPVTPSVMIMEVAKSSIILAIAVWLAIAQLAAWRRRHAPMARP